MFYGLDICLKVRTLKLILYNFLPQNEIFNAKHILWITFNINKNFRSIDPLYKAIVRQQQARIDINKISEI